MARKPKIEPIKSENYQVCIEMIDKVDPLMNNQLYHAPHGWFVRERTKCAETKTSQNWEDYYALKRVWRKSKLDFESACRFMDFKGLFSTAGVKL